MFSGSDSARSSRLWIFVELNIATHVNVEQTILLIEDDSNDTLLLQRAFRRAGLTHILRVVTDGDEAVTYLKGDEPFNNREAYPIPSLVLLDLKLPRRSGLEVLSWLR